MAVSGDSVYTQNRNQIIKAAGRKIGAWAAGETPDPQTVKDFSEALNSMVKRWNTTGIHLWTETEATMFLQPGQYQYTVGPNSTDNATESYGQTYLTADYSSGTSITVFDITDIASGDYVGVVLNSGDIGWTTVNGAPSGTTVTLTAALDDTANSGSNVYFYTSKIVKPLRIPYARRFYIPSSIDTPMTPLSRKDYRDQPNKANTGTITQYFYDPQRDVGYIWLWPAPTDALSAFKFTWYRPIMNFDTAANTPDFPQEWTDTLIFNLALVMASEYSVPEVTYNRIEKIAMQFLEDMKGWDREPESTYFGVDFTSGPAGSGSGSSA